MVLLIKKKKSVHTLSVKPSANEVYVVRQTILNALGW